MRAFAIVWRAIKALYDDLFLYVWLSVLWWLGTLLVLPAAPVTVGLQQVANRAANYKRVDSSFFWEAARQNISRGWLLYAGNLLAVGGVIFNIIFYLRGSGWMQFVAVLWIWVLLTLLMMGQYFFPLFWQQDETNLILMVRNAAVLTFRHPLYSLLLLLIQLLLLIASVALTLPLFLFTPALVALIGNFGMNGLLEQMGLVPEPPESHPRRR